jgi:SPP1 family predicted phage head-tail adaptor
MIGKMQHRITLKSPERITDSDVGYKTIWNEARKVWAEFLKQSHRRQSEAAVNFSDGIQIEVSIRYCTDVRKGWRFSEGTREFSVLGTYYEGRVKTIMVCEEVVADG